MDKERTTGFFKKAWNRTLSWRNTLCVWLVAAFAWGVFSIGSVGLHWLDATAWFLGIMFFAPPGLFIFLFLFAIFGFATMLAGICVLLGWWMVFGAPVKRLIERFIETLKRELADDMDIVVDEEGIKVKTKKEKKEAKEDKQR